MKYNITYKCGHEAKIELFGKSSDRERKIAWLETCVCDECRARAQAEAASRNGLPELVGSDKQIAWACDVRTKIIKMAGEIVLKLQSKDVPMAEEAIEAIKANTSARFWIDNRNLTEQGVAALIVNTYRSLH